MSLQSYYLVFETLPVPFPVPSQYLFISYVFSDIIQWYVLIYLDDILVYGETTKNCKKYLCIFMTLYLIIYSTLNGPT